LEIIIIIIIIIIYTFLRDELNKSLQDCKTESSLAIRTDDVMLTISHLKPDKCDGIFFIVFQSLSKCMP